MTSLEAIQLIMAVTQYCSSSGQEIQYNHFAEQNRSNRNGAMSECFKLIWHCGHDVKDASVIGFETHNCISKHLDGSLK